MSTDWSSLMVGKVTTSTAGRLATLVGVIWLTLQSSANPAEALALTGKKGTVWYDWGQPPQTVVNNAMNKNGIDGDGHTDDDQTVLPLSELRDFSNVPIFPPPALPRSLDDQLIASSRPLTLIDVEQKAHVDVNSRQQQRPTTDNVYEGEEYVDRLMTASSWLNELLQNDVERLNRTLTSVTERNDDDNDWPPSNFKPTLDRPQDRIDKRHVPQQLQRIPRSHHHHHLQHHQNPGLLGDAAAAIMPLSMAGATVESGDNWEAEWGVSHPVCPSRTQWSLLRVARDIYGNEVEVYQPSHDSNLFATPKASSRRKRRSAGTGGEDSFNSRRTTTHHRTHQQQHHHQHQLQQQHGAVGLQWFYTVSCYNESSSVINKRACPGCCFGIDHSRFLSSCRQRKSLTMALIRRPDERRFHFDWIQVNSSCSCAVVNKELFEPEYEDELQ